MFITFEGGDGAGKTTQIELLKAALEKEGRSVVVTREPGGNAVAEKIRELLLDRASVMEDMTEAYLYAAARAEHVRAVILPALARGQVVLCDRFIDSSVAYQGYGRQIGAVQLCGGTLPQMLSAFSHALSACMGLVCDPVAGLVQVPCAQRNASQAVSALVSADQALAGQVFPIPADQVVGAMYRVGRQLPPELKETAQGGIAATDRGKEIAREIHKGA